MKIKFIQAVVFIFAITSGLIATELVLELEDVPNLVLENEKTAQPTVFVGTPFQIKVIVKDGEGGSLQIPGLDKLKVLGKSHMNSQHNINGAVSIEQSIILSVVATQEGAFTIGPAGDDKHRNVAPSNILKFRAINQSNDQANIKTASGKSLKDQIRDKDVVCELLTDKKAYYQGEPFIVTLKIMVYDQVAQLGIERMNFSGFASKDFGQQQNHQELKGGKLVDIVEKKYSLVSLQSGAKKIDPAIVSYQAHVKTNRRSRGLFGDDFFSGFFDQMQLQQKQSQSNNIKLEIKPLPKTDSSVDGIGEFKAFSMSVDKQSALVNEAVALTLEINGSGNFDQIATPKLVLPDFVKNYESKNDFTQDNSLGAFGGKKRFEYVIQVSVAGDIKIPSQSFTYFDTRSQTYKTLKTEEIALSIKQPVGERVQQPVLPQNSELDQQDPEPKVSKQISRDIGFIEEELKKDMFNGFQIPFWVFLILLLFPVFYIFNLYAKLGAIFCASALFKIFSKKTILAKFQSEFEALKTKNSPEKIHILFLSLLATKFDTTTQLITMDFVEQKLLASGWDAKKVSDFVDYLNECASLHFITSRQKVSDDLAGNLFKNGQYWIMLLISKDALKK